MSLKAGISLLATKVQLPNALLQFATATGLIIKDNSGTLQVLAADGTTPAEVQGAAPTTGSSYVTKTYGDANYGGAAAASKTYKITGTTATVTGSAVIPANSVVTSVTLTVTTALDGTTPAMSIGTTASAALFVASADINVAAANTTDFTGASISVGGSDVAPRVTITGSGITTGAWEVDISYTVTPTV